MAAIGGAVTAGMPSLVGDISGLSASANMAIRAALSSAATQGIGVATGLQKSFNWVGVAAAAASAGIGREMDEALGVTAIGFDATSAEGFAKNALSGAVSGIASSVVRGGKVDVVDIAADAFGNALGDSIAQQLRQSSEKTTPLTFAQDVAIRKASMYKAPDKVVDNWDASVLGGGDDPHSPTTTITLKAAPLDNQSLINANNLATMPGYYSNSVAGSSYVVRPGDSLSSIAGTSNPQVIGNLAAANGMSSSRLNAGGTIFIPDEMNAYGDTRALGQSMLNADNAQIAQQRALAAQQAQQQQNTLSVDEQAYATYMRAGGRNSEIGVPIISPTSSSTSTSVALVDQIPTDGYRHAPPPDNRGPGDGVLGKIAEFSDRYITPLGPAGAELNLAIEGTALGIKFLGVMGRSVMRSVDIGANSFGNTARTLDLSNPNVLFSSAPSDLAGVERASPKLLQTIQERRAVTIAEPGTDAERFLNYRDAEAAAFGAEDILVRPGPSKAALLEEFLHGTQQRLGIIDNIGRAASETHVKDFMIRHQNMLGLSAEDVRRLQILKDMGL